MAPGDLEDRVNSSSGKGLLESIAGGVRQVTSGIGSLLYYSYYTAKASLGLAAGVAIAGPSALMLPFGMMAGRYTNDVINKKKKTFKQRFKECANLGLVGGLLGGYLGQAFMFAEEVGTHFGGMFGKIGYVASKAAVGLVNMIPFLGIHEYLDRLFVSDYKPKSVSEKIKENAGMIGLLSLPIMANYSITPEHLKLPVAGLISWMYGGITSEKEKKQEPQPQLPPGYGQPQLA